MAKCKNCGAELQSGAKFCMECGTPVPQVICCSKCGAELSATAKFCPECGTPVSKQSTIGINNNHAPKVQKSIETEELCTKAKQYYEDKNYFKALGIFREIAEQDAEAQYYLGLCYRDGLGLKQDITEATQWLEKAANNGQPDAQCALACMYVVPDYGMQDYNKAVEWFTKAAEQGDVSSAANIGLMLLYGTDIEQSTERGLHWLELASKGLKSSQGQINTIAALAMGNCYFDGIGVTKDIEQAYFYYDQIFNKLGYSTDGLFEYDKQAIVTALFHFADLCLNNIGNHGNYDHAIWAYNQLIEHFDNADAKVALAKVEKDKNLIRVVDVYGNGSEMIHVDGNGLIYSEDGTIFIGLNIKSNYCQYNNETTSITIPNGIKIIGEEAFYDGRDKLKNVILPDTVTEIKSKAFQFCSELQSINLPEGLQIIGDEAFYGCDKLSDIQIPTSVREIGRRAFYGCYSIEGITIPEGITEIKEGTFSSCKKIKELIFPDSNNNLTTIEDSAFGGCTGLNEVEFPDSLQVIGNDAFAGCGLEEITFGNEIRIIGNSAFRDTNVKSVKLPSTSVEIAPDAFGGVGPRIEIYYAENKASNENDSMVLIHTENSEHDIYVDKQGLVYSEDKTIVTGVRTTGESYLYDENTTSITIPSGVTTIASEAFANQGKIETVNLPDTLISIESGAFAFSKNIKEMEFPDSLQRIGDYAFNYCEDLCKVTFGKDLESIGENAFQRCCLKEIKLGEKLQSIGKYAFNGNILQVADFGEGSSLKRIGKAAFTENDIDSIILPVTPIEIHEEAFSSSTEVIREDIRLKKKEAVKAIDLGLTVQWGSCNLGALAPIEVGHYYAWGETEPKEKFLENNYTEKEYEEDEPLKPEDDAAHVFLGDGWYMPTKEDIEELQKCQVAEKEIDGVKGYELTGLNGNTIFFPHNDYYDSREDNALCRMKECKTWSASAFDDTPQTCSLIKPDILCEGILCGMQYQSDGLPIRPVYLGEKTREEIQALREKSMVTCCQDVQAFTDGHSSLMVKAMLSNCQNKKIVLATYPELVNIDSKETASTVVNDSDWYCFMIGKIGTPLEKILYASGKPEKDIALAILVDGKPIAIITLKLNFKVHIFSKDEFSVTKCSFGQV